MLQIGLKQSFVEYAQNNQKDPKLIFVEKMVKENYENRYTSLDDYLRDQITDVGNDINLRVIMHRQRYREHVANHDCQCNIEDSEHDNVRIESETQEILNSVDEPINKVQLQDMYDDGGQQDDDFEDKEVPCNGIDQSSNKPKGDILSSLVQSIIGEGNYLSDNEGDDEDL